MPNKFITVPLVVTAIKVEKTPECETKVRKLAKTMTGFNEKVFFLGSAHHGRYGDWAIFVNGTIRILSEEQFHEQYNPFPSQP